LFLVYLSLIFSPFSDVPFFLLKKFGTGACKKSKILYNQKRGARMSIKPKTVDNLGLEASIQYAKGKAFLDPRLIEESKWVPQKTETSATKPYVPSEFDQLFSLSKTTKWALFSPPPNYEAQMRAVFSYQLIPSLGPFEKQEADSEKIAAIEDALQKKRDSKKGGQGQQDFEEEEKERKIVADLLSCIHMLDRTLTLINARRSQYQRG
jgi:hypothetical protein